MTDLDEQMVERVGRAIAISSPDHDMPWTTEEANDMARAAIREMLGSFTDCGTLASPFQTIFGGERTQWPPTGERVYLAPEGKA